MTPNDLGPPPWWGMKRVEDAPYPMTHEEFMAWPREPGYKYELHDGMCVRIERGPEVQRILNKLAEALGEYAEKHGGTVLTNQYLPPEEEE